LTLDQVNVACKKIKGLVARRTVHTHLPQKVGTRFSIALNSFPQNRCLGFKEPCLVYQYTLDFPIGVFQRFKTMADKYTTVPTTRLNEAYTRSIDQGGVEIN
jgi:hypothetical protein